NREFILPSLVTPWAWASRRDTPAHIGVAILVPPVRAKVGAGSVVFCVATKNPGNAIAGVTPTAGPSAPIATSGISRAASLGTPTPVCHAGLPKITLGPPPLASLIGQKVGPVSLLFQTLSRPSPTVL